MTMLLKNLHNTSNRSCISNVESGILSTKMYYFPSFEELHNCTFSYNETGCSVFQNNFFFDKESILLLKLKREYPDPPIQYFEYRRGTPLSILCLAIEKSHTWPKHKLPYSNLSEHTLFPQ